MADFEQVHTFKKTITAIVSSRKKNRKRAHNVTRFILPLYKNNETSISINKPVKHKNGKL